MLSPKTYGWDGVAPSAPCHFFHPREPTNLRLHSRDVLSINSPSQRAAGGGTLIVYVRVRETGRETVLFNKFGINYASCSHANPAIYNSSVWISDAFTTMSNCVSVWEILQSLCRTSIVSVSLSLGKMSTASHLLPFLSMLACVCEDSSCILRSRSRGKHLPLSPDSTSSSSSCPHLTLMAVGFLMRKRVSLCSVPMEDLGGWAGGGEWCTGAKHIPRLWSSNTRLAGWDRGGHSLSKYCHALLQPSKSKTSQPQHSACLALLSAQWTGTRHYGNRHACVKLLGFVNQKGCCKQYTMAYFFVSLIVAMWELSCLIRSTTKDWVDWKLQKLT